jgi:hypothetical protein
MVIDHTQKQDELIKALADQGPFAVAVDAISSSQSLAVTTAVVAALGGRKIYTVGGLVDPETVPDGVLPVTCPETLPEGFNPSFAGWSVTVDYYPEPRQWGYSKYLPQAVANGKLLSLPLEEVPGGLNNVEDALNRIQRGVSGIKLMLDPWE